MKSRKILVLFAVLIAVNQTNLRAAYVRGQNWADRVIEHTARIQRFGKPGCSGGQFMDPNTHWWILGPPDCDVNNDGYAWTPDGTGEGIIDRDSVAGWKGAGDLNKDQELVVVFDIGLEDYEEIDDLVIRLYSGYKAKASVWASVDGNDFTQIGEIIGRDDGLPGIPGWLCDVTFDFSNRFDQPVQYLKVHRESNAPDTGMFFDAIGSAVVMEPSSCEQVHDYGWRLDSDLFPDCRTNFYDYALFAEDCAQCNDPEDPMCGATDFDALGYRPSCCHGMWQSGLGLVADLDHDCYVNCNDLYVLATQWLQENELGIYPCSIEEHDHASQAGARP